MPPLLNLSITPYHQQDKNKKKSTVKEESYLISLKIPSVQRNNREKKLTPKNECSLVINTLIFSLQN